MKRNHWYIVIAFFIIFISLLLLNDRHREQALKKAYKTYAIVLDKPFSGAKIPLSIQFAYRNQDGERVTISRGVGKDECPLEKGDTIYIRYSLTDKHVAEIVHCFWNDKLRADMNNQ